MAASRENSHFHEVLQQRWGRPVPCDTGEGAKPGNCGPDPPTWGTLAFHDQTRSHHGAIASLGPGGSQQVLLETDAGGQAGHTAMYTAGGAVFIEFNQGQSVEAKEMQETA